eukprot:scaffold1996_cov127-Cylindrotheca_fusiformis.AAC.8
MSRINQPSNQVRLTNVAVVRMMKGGKRFEIACYRNKAVDYRQGLEQDLSEVLQTDRIFTNVSKGEFCKSKDLQKVFGTKNEEDIARIILQKGQVQVSDKERSQQLEKTTAQVAEWISKNCVHPGSDRPYTISQIKHAMSQSTFSVHPTKPLKRQYLDCVKLLQGVIPIQRAKMELLLIIPSKEDCEKIEQALEENDVTWSEPELVDDSNQSRQYRVYVDPSLYRVLNDEIETMKGARIEIITQIVTKQGDIKLESAGAIDDPIDDPIKQVREVTLSKPGEAAVESKESGSEEDEPRAIVSRRKQQKKARKKNQKSQRREDTDYAVPDDDSMENPSTLTQSAERATTASTKAGSDGSGRNDTRKSCNTCGGFFDSASAFRTHFKSDWHQFNQKLKMKGVAPISEEEFLICDSGTFFGGDDGLL